jgi:hypothetical protein
VTCLCCVRASYGTDLVSMHILLLLLLQLLACSLPQVQIRFCQYQLQHLCFS